ncbi:MAG: DinB family protein [Bacteroidetes bacterium]|nr:DinB family protein [Bacteroidota bacterium]
MGLLEKIQNNAEELLKSFHTLNQASLVFKPSEKAWSVLECVEHIFLINEAVLKVISTPAPIEKTENSKTELFGEQKLNMLLIANRAFKVPAPDFVCPKGSFPDSKAATQSINIIIDKIIQHITNNGIEQETHTIKHPVLGAMTKTDWIHFMIAHTNRHILQIEELQKTI